MSSVLVDQVLPDGEVTQGVDAPLSESQKNDLLLAVLPGARAEVYAGVRVIRFQDQVLLKKQVTHLGKPWPSFKKRIQIPSSWLRVHAHAVADGLQPRFLGIYQYEDVVIFVDFDPTFYVQRQVNNSSAHISTNDLHQAQVFGVFGRRDSSGNRLTSVRADVFGEYILGVRRVRDDRLAVFEKFNKEIFTGQRLEALDAIREMHVAAWPDAFQGEWPGFYLEYRIASFIRSHGLTDLVDFQKVKGRGGFDYDLIFPNAGEVEFFGDLKASSVTSSESPGNDAAGLARCLETYGRFWYVIYEHKTWHSRDNRDRATVDWNRWKQSVGYRSRKPYDPLSYFSRFKEAVLFERMSVLEVNEANFWVVLGNFPQGQQQSGAERALKVMIHKRNIDNFLIYSSPVR